jgi:hypothetical protein
LSRPCIPCLFFITTASAVRSSSLRTITKAEVLSKLSPQGRRALMGEVAADGKTRIHKR